MISAHDHGTGVGSWLRSPSVEVAVLSFDRPSRSTRGVVAATACLVWLGAAASAAQSADGPPVCPDSYTAQTLEENLVRYAGFYTEQEIRDGFASRDRNGNGIVCGKPFQKDRYYPLQNLRDDLPSPGS